MYALRGFGHPYEGPPNNCCSVMLQRRILVSLGVTLVTKSGRGLISRLTGLRHFV